MQVTYNQLIEKDNELIIKGGTYLPRTAVRVRMW